MSIKFTSVKTCSKKMLCILNAFVPLVRWNVWKRDWNNWNTETEIIIKQITICFRFLNQLWDIPEHVFCNCIWTKNADLMGKWQYRYCAKYHYLSIGKAQSPWDSTHTCYSNQNLIVIIVLKETTLHFWIREVGT